MRADAMICVLALSTVTVLAAKPAPLTGPLASPEHWAEAKAPGLLGELASKMKEINSKDSRNLARVGELQLRAGQTAEAEKTFAAALASDPKDDEACRIIAVTYRDLKMWDKADEWFKKATELDPKDLDHQVEWGVSYWLRGDHKKAAEIFTKVLGAEPETERLYYKIGQGIGR